MKNNRLAKKISSDTSKIHPGDHVFIAHLNKKGIIEKLVNDKVSVYIGNIKILLNISDISRVKLFQNLPLNSAKVHPLPLVDSLDLHGFYTEDALKLVEKHILNAYVAGISKFTILHGKGSGKLQKAIHDYLKCTPEVLKFHFAAPYEGGSGKTLVYIR